MAEKQTVEEMREAYDGEWAIVVDCEYDEARRLVRGRVAEHSPRKRDIYGAIKNHPEGGAIEFFGKIPNDLALML